MHAAQMSSNSPLMVLLQLRFEFHVLPQRNFNDLNAHHPVLYSMLADLRLGCNVRNVDDALARAATILSSHGCSLDSKSNRGRSLALATGY
jgi:hypothetical protein